MFHPFGDLPWLNSNIGYQTDYGVWSPPGSRVFYVCNGSRTGDDSQFTARLVGGGGSNSTLANALSMCRAGMQDTIYILPGHSENVTDATMLTGLVAGTRVIGLGYPNRDDAPTFNFTATGSQWAVAAKNCLFAGLRLLMDGANGVVKAINVTASGTQFVNNWMRWSSGAANLATIALEVGSTATDFLFYGNTVRGVAAGVVTDGIKIVGATPPSGYRIEKNKMHAAVTSATGLINVTVAALNGYIGYNTIENMTASSIAAITFGNVACDGECEYNNITVKSTGAHVANTTGITIGAGCLVGFHQNFSVNDPLKSGLLIPAADT